MKASKLTDAQKAFVMKQGEEGTHVADSAQCSNSRSSALLRDSGNRTYCITT